jgi:hypothetical protein
VAQQQGGLIRQPAKGKRLDAPLWPICLSAPTVSPLASSGSDRIETVFLRAMGEGKASSFHKRGAPHFSSRGQLQTLLSIFVQPCCSPCTCRVLIEATESLAKIAKKFWKARSNCVRKQGGDSHG